MDDDALFAPVELSWGEGREGTRDGGDSQPEVPEGHDDYPVHPQSVQRDDGDVTRKSDPSHPARRLEIRGFIDSGASHSILSYAFVTRHGIHILPDSSRGSCLLGDGSARVDHIGLTEPVRVRCGNYSFTYSFHILRLSAHDAIMGRDMMRSCGMAVTNVPVVFPADVDGDRPRRMNEQQLRDRKRLTLDRPSPVVLNNT